MLEQERIQSILEILQLFNNTKKVLSKITNSYFRSRKYMGSQDRKFVSNTLWDIIKHRNKIRWHLNNIDIEVTFENEIILGLFFLNEKYKGNFLEIKHLFTIKFSNIKNYSNHDLEFLNNLKFDKFYDNEMPEEVYFELPKFLLKSIKRAFPDDWKKVVLSLHNEAHIDIRVNELKQITREKIQFFLKEITVDMKLTHYSPKGIRLLKRYPIEGHKLYKSGHIEVQGEASQIASLIVGAKPGMSVADLCCGAGGKSLVLAEQMNNKGRILALDINQKRLDNAGARFKKAGIHNIERKLVKKNWQVGSMAKKFNLVLIDAPCSGIGTWSRSPDSKFKFSEDDLANLIKTQYELLEKGMRMVAPGGKLAYMVCSFLPEEGVDQIKKIKQNYHEFSEINLFNMWNDTILLMNGLQYPFINNRLKSIILNPSTHKTDGFFISMFQRKR